MIDVQKLIEECDLYQHVKVERVRAKKVLKSDLPPSLIYNLPRDDRDEYCYFMFHNDHIQIVSTKTFDTLFSLIEEAEVIYDE